MLYGRDSERAQIGELLERARASVSGVLVVSGEPGVGKTALLKDARDQAGDMRVLIGAGVQSETHLPFAALHQIVRPVLGQLDAIPASQASALRAGLGLEGGRSNDRFLVSLAVLSLLAETAETRPLLCLVDDAHWLDDASADTLVFVARRLAAESIVMLFAARDGEVRRFDAHGLPELRLSGLHPAAARMLIERETTTAVSPEIRDRLIAETGGNPLALLELPSVLNEAQLSGAEPVLAPIPISTRVERAFLDRVRRLPEPTQTMLLVAAAEDTGDLATVLGAATRLGVPSRALDSAERAGLVSVRGARLELRHPLVRSAVYQAAPFSRRQAAHYALAEVLEAEGDADRKVWHRAVASVEPDPEVVAELEQVAQRARRRSGFAAASLAFERAATLTTDDDLRARRLTLAAENAWLAGRVERAHVLLEGARPLVSDPIQRADIEANAGLIEMTRGVPAEASRLLLRAARDVGPIDADRAFELLNSASLAAAYAGDDDAMVGIAAVARGLTVGDDPFRRMLAQLLIGIGAHTAGDFGEAARRLREARELAQRLEDATAADQPMALLFAGRVAIFLGDDDVAYRAHQEAAGRTRASGALSVLAQILTRLIVLEIFAGRLATAEATAIEGIELARQTGNHDIAAQDLALLAVIAAARGSEDECRSLFSESRGLAAARGLGVVEAFADWAMVMLELGLGRADEALERSREISSTVVTCWSALDRIEAAIRVGERDTACAWLEPFARWAESSAALWARAVVLHCRALLTDDGNEAEGLFLTALETHAGTGRPFERARSELAYGEFLRRDRRRVESREHLRKALDGFERLGAALWAERARVELRASGQTARKRDSSTRDELTAQELQIARFVSEGLTNREVATQLFLSPRTIDFHLRNIFRKLGITSRTALARLELN